MKLDRHPLDDDGEELDQTTRQCMRRQAQHAVF
jgi:hypothetical protein